MSNYFDQLLDAIAQDPLASNSDPYIRNCLLGRESKEEVAAMRQRATEAISDVGLFCVILGVRTVEDLIVELRSAAGASPKVSGFA